MARLTFKQIVGRFIISKSPINEHVFNHVRLEMNAIRVRMLHRFHPAYRSRVKQLRMADDLKINIGCGPFGKEGWINLDLHAHDCVTITADCRRSLPLGDEKCCGIHAEHYFEHLNHSDERHAFLLECFRCLRPGGVLRIIVPDAERFVRAYAADGWAEMTAISAEDSNPRENFLTKMEVLNHVFVQGYEHFGGYDMETLATVLLAAGFHDVKRWSYGEGRFPDGCIDRKLHEKYSLYLEATK